MRYKTLPILISIILFSTNIFVLAADDFCIDNAQTNQGIDECGNLIVPDLKKSIDKKFKRLKQIYKDSPEMIFIIDITKQSWDDYRNLLWNLEGAIVAGGQTKGVLPFEANKAYLKRVIRTLEEMDVDLTAWIEISDGNKELIQKNSKQRVPCP